ncbi:alpha/beta fold hydrolase [Streptomyces sp. NBC_01381]|uniref:alpha/beta hydrolase n=1 Tax=Streptomyces sp. NBC_01381 TaxID=2903845 RepID=UPI00224EE6B3|nr:alpha/beta fold hydrolase [Streptomyces sp. NBC_01381]MCX4672343.1 alpha/beta fold hydrolase [Streptomyces sp. NBC_01381]
MLVHGLFSSAEVWTSFRELITTDPELSGRVTVHCFQYDSPLARLRPDRRVAETDDIADQLDTYLKTEVGDAESIVLVTHSQGGLVVQRFLARKLWHGEGGDLTRIKHFTMFACPNTGSGFFLTVRKFLRVIWRNPQERQLRPFDRSVTEAQRTVLSGVAHARRCSGKECPIPIEAYGGSADNIVPPVVARGVFPSGGVVAADHFSIVQPTGRSAESYRIVRTALLSAAAPRTQPIPPSPPEPAPEQQGGQSVLPPYSKLQQGKLKGKERLSLVASVMSSPPQQRVHILAGLGGSGKSRVALEIADRARLARRRVWWVSASELSACMRTVANELGAPAAQVEQAWRRMSTSTDLVWSLLDASPEPWLLVLDNADDPQQLGPRDGPVSYGTGWLREPATDGGMVIVTSRVRSKDTWGSWSHVHQVPLLDEDDGASMLLERTNGVGGTNEQARQLSVELGGLPLALRAAADFVKVVSEGTVSLDDEGIRDFESYRKAVKRHFESAPGTRDHDLSELLGREIVEKTYGIALDLLTRQGVPQAAPMLKVFACLNIAPIPYRCLLNGEAPAESPLFSEFSTAQRRSVLQKLEDFGLVDVDERADVNDPELPYVLTLHPVVHGVLRDDEDVQRRRTDYYGLAARMLLDAIKGKDPDSPSNWPLWAAIAPHSVDVTQSSLLDILRLEDRSVLVDALELIRLTARYWIATGLLGPAREVMQPIVANCTSFGFHKDDREILGLRHEKGRITLESEEHTAAEKELQQVVAARTRLLGEDHTDTLASRHKLARAILEQNRVEEAEQLLRSIIKAENRVSGPEHHHTLVVRHSLARALLGLNRPADAEAEVREVLEICRRNKWPPSHPEVLWARLTLARCLLHQNPRDAEIELRGALSDTAQPADSYRMMLLRHTLCLALLRLGRTREAVWELRDLVVDQHRVLPPDNPLRRRTQQLLDKTLKEIQGSDGDDEH